MFQDLLDEYAHYYNHERSVAALGYKSPVQYKTELSFLYYGVLIVYFYLTNSLNRFDFKISFDVFYYFILMLILAIAASSYAFLF